ncbi:hypothetical protein [Methylocella sp.]|uniref:hypothetical protein n=1 Tax=Methylocella sp. TaxID=1978226 RepID=UPI00378318ED
MGLMSNLFRGDPKLEACLVSDPAHVFQGAQGAHVGKIQQALVTLGAGFIGGGELGPMRYGLATARTVVAFKAKRGILQPWQSVPDDIVGKKTIAALDAEIAALENRPAPPPSPFVITPLVSMTPYGWPHNHKTCPPEVGQGEPVDGRVNHIATPTNPKATGRMLNLGGEGETRYLGFIDVVFYFVPESAWRGRPLITSIPDRSVSDMCSRSAPLSHHGSREKAFAEMRRVAMPGCRVTYSNSEAAYAGMRPHLLQLGRLVVETEVSFSTHANEDNTVLVIEMF